VPGGAAERPSEEAEVARLKAVKRMDYQRNPPKLAPFGPGSFIFSVVRWI
jgi:hypothetical protein